eukprot:239202-Lingulodinium_polyedra.AAC.1
MRGRCKEDNRQHTPRYAKNGGTTQDKNYRVRKTNPKCLKLLPAVLALWRWPFGVPLNNG